MRYLVLTGFLLGWLITDMVMPVNSEPAPVCTYTNGDRVRVLTDPDRCAAIAALDASGPEKPAAHPRP